VDIKVGSLLPLNDGQTLVSFSSDYGACEGLWEGTLPNINRNYDVEIDIVDDLIWNVNVFETKESKYRLAKADKSLKIVAELESIEKDSCCVLRLGNAILMAEIKGLPQLAKGFFVELSPKVIKLFDSNL
jgi:hypothetical protein